MKFSLIINDFSAVIYSEKFQKLLLASFLTCVIFIIVYLLLRFACYLYYEEYIVLPTLLIGISLFLTIVYFGSICLLGW